MKNKALNILRKSVCEGKASNFTKQYSCIPKNLYSPISKFDRQNVMTPNIWDTSTVFVRL